jgi:pSer/pThr/pTyr-binding forkhead associated (FHA) protein
VSTSAKLTVRIPNEPEMTHDLGRKTVSVGRAADNAIRIKDFSVSLHHAQFFYKRGRYVLTDLGSTNGTRVNGYYIKNFKLSDGDRLLFGNVFCLFELAEEFVVSKLQTSRLLRVSRNGKLLGYFTPENARENMARGILRADDTVCHDS